MTIISYVLVKFKQQLVTQVEGFHITHHYSNYGGT